MHVHCGPASVCEARRAPWLTPPAPHDQGSFQKILAALRAAALGHTFFGLSLGREPLRAGWAPGRAAGGAAAPPDGRASSEGEARDTKPPAERYGDGSAGGGGASGLCCGEGGGDRRGGE